MTPRKTALVTGAARGIGLATTKAFLGAGWRVAMLDRDVPALTAAADGLADILALPFDVSDPTAMKDAYAAYGAWSVGLDALVNNAGVAEFAPLENHDFAMWRRIMETNLDGAFLCAQTFLPALKRVRGAIVNVASISGLRASTLRAAYGTSKAALMHLTRQQAVELGEFGIRANCVAPGPVKTKLAMAVHSPEIIQAYHDAIPLNRYGSEDEIAQVIRFLCSDEASYVTGQIIAADGGFDATGVGLPALRDY